MIKLGSSNIGKIYLGSNSIGRAYLGSNLVFQKGSSPTPPQPTPDLPAGYTELLYVSTNSNAYIDTGIAGGQDIEVIVKFRVGNYVQYGSIYGNYVGENYSCNRAILASQTSLYVSGGDNLAQSVSSFSVGVIHVLSVTRTTAILDGVSTSITHQEKTANTKNICLGNRAADIPIEKNIGLRIYSFEIKKNGTTVLSLVPAIRDYDGAVGFYDFVSESFVKSLTGTEFVAGPVVGFVPYIRGGADGSYIDTGIIPDNNTRVIVWARNFNPPVASQMLFGCMDSGATTNSFGFGSWGANSCGRIAVYFGDYTNPYTVIDDAFRYLGGYHKYELDGKVLKIDDITIATSASTDTISTVHTIHLFGRNTGGTHTAMNFPADVCACKIYKGGVLVRDYTPVSSPSVGLYDSVSDTVFTNTGSGSFTYGTFNTNAYTPLEYIATSGDSYFLTPAIGSYSLPIVTKFRPTATNASWFSPIGGRDNGNYDNRCEIFTGNTTYSNARLYSVLGSGDSTTMYSSTTAGAVRNKDIIVVKSNNTFTAYYNNAAFGSAATFNVGASYSTGVPLAIGATWQVNISACISYFVGNIYYVGLGAYNLVPAKVGGVAGMYDTYNDIFYQSTTSTPFTAGPEI